ncbi:MAG: hypothetical protein KFF50_08930 [Desulfatitalea sp.]|nr:hypothetical protein [Desulfatitalea sp.]
MHTPAPSNRTPLRIAHRGARDEAPENTHSAFERALDYPIDGIELDVQMSADGVSVIYHDATLWRVARRRWRVADRTRAQLAQLDWGSWFHRDFSGEPLPTLARTLERFGGRTRLLLEIKTVAADHASGHAERMVRGVLGLLEDTRHTIFPEHIFILSFDDQALRLAHRLAPQWQYVLNAPQRQPNLAMTMAAPQINALHALCVDIRYLSDPLARWVKEQGLRLFTYTCNNPRQVRKALRLGVDALMTDRPGWLTRHMEDTGNGPARGRESGHRAGGDPSEGEYQA